MNFFNVISAIVGWSDAVDRQTEQLRRIAEAVERIFPPPPDPPEPSNAPYDFYVAESPTEFQERIDTEAAFAAELGVAPWSPDFIQAVRDMQSDILRSKKGEGGLYTQEEARRIIRQAFLEAKAANNTR